MFSRSADRAQSALFGRAAFIASVSLVGTEFLTGSSPVLLLPRSVASPAFFIVAAFYGCGVLLVREAAAIWSKGWLSILAFGAAYAVVEEGLFAKTWFAAIPITYGRWHDVNWAFGIAETIVEAMFSIAIPIALSRLAFPGSESRRWLPGKRLAFVSLLYLGIVALGFRASFHQYTHPAAQIPLALAMIGALVAAGAAIAPPGEPPRQTPRPTPRALGLAAFASTAAVFLLAPLWMDPRASHSRFLPAPLVDGLALAFLIRMFRCLDRLRPGSAELWAAAMGAASVMMSWAILGPQRQAGAPLAVPVYLGFFIYARRRMEAVT